MSRDKFREATEANRLLLSAAMMLAPTGVEQRAFAALANESPDPFDEAQLLLGGMLDGLRFGNWPGTDYRLPDQ